MKIPRLLPVLVLLLLVLTFPGSVRAAGACTVLLDGRPMDSRYAGVIRGDTAYLPLRAAADHYGGRLDWDAKTRTAHWAIRGLTLTARDGMPYLEANGRALYAPQGIFIRDGRLMIPARLLAACMGGSAGWNAGTRQVSVSAGAQRIESGGSFYDADALLWLSRIISAESRGEPLRGQIAVGNVVLNRVRSKAYPNTIYGVIFDRRYGVQFEPVLNGSIYAEPTEGAVLAAKLCLEGVDLSRGSLYFYDPLKAQSSWIGNNRTYVMTIGVHKFYL